MTTRELTTFEDFRNARLEDAGYIVILGTARSPVVHRLNGKCVSADNFRSKVLDEGATGKYYLVDSISSGIKELGASVCKICKPLRPEKQPWKE